MDVSKAFAGFYRQLYERWRDSGEDMAPFDQYERETIALYLFNSDYGADGLDAYFAWQELRTHELAIAGLVRIGAHDLAGIVRTFAELLERNGFNSADESVYDFIETCTPLLGDQLDSLHVAAAELYEDFYARWESHYAERMGLPPSA